MATIRFVDNKTPTPEYRAYNGMLGGCGFRGKVSKETASSYSDRGITVCEEWRESFFGFEKFLAHVGPKPSIDMVLDRKDNNGNYEPGNVRWVTKSESNKNKRNAVMLAHHGKTMNLIDWSKETGINYGKIEDRLKNNWSVEDALTIGAIYESD